MSIYKITKEQLDNLVFKYLDIALKDLKRSYKRISEKTWRYTWTLPKEDKLIFIFNQTSVLYISGDFISFVQKLFSIDYKLIGDSILRWFQKRFKMKVNIVAVI